jgi:hypothetical protein
MSCKPIWQRKVHFVDIILEYYGIIGDDAVAVMACQEKSMKLWQDFLTYGRCDKHG